MLKQKNFYFVKYFFKNFMSLNPAWILAPNWKMGWRKF